MAVSDCGLHFTLVYDQVGGYSTSGTTSAGARLGQFAKVFALRREGVVMNLWASYSSYFSRDASMRLMISRKFS